MGAFSIFFQDRMAAGVRVCGTCSACCKTHGVTLAPDTYKPKGVWCPHWDKQERCTIYKTRPRDCQDFRCEWLKGYGSDSLRPDRTKVVLDFVNLPDGPQGGMLQMFEVSEGALLKSDMQALTQEVCTRGVTVVHVPLGRQKKIFIPRRVKDFTEVVESATEEGYIIVLV